MKFHFHELVLVFCKTLTIVTSQYHVVLKRITRQLNEKICTIFTERKLSPLTGLHTIRSRLLLNGEFLCPGALIGGHHLKLLAQATDHAAYSNST